MSTAPDPTIPAHVVLVPGFWLGAWAWDDVVPHLETAGLVPHAMTLPGLEPGATAQDRAASRRAERTRSVPVQPLPAYPRHASPRR